MSKLNKIEGYCLEVLKKSQKFLSDPKNDDYIDVNTHPIVTGKQYPSILFNLLI